MSRIIPRNRYNCPVHIPPLQRTARGLVRITPRGIQAPPARPLRTVVTMPRPRVWMSALAYGTLNVIAFVLIVASMAMLTIALLCM
jgi:hypothetical protein